MTPADQLLPRLHGVRERGRGQWSARCPAHEDHSPSLSIKERDDGALLLHCWAGCEVDAIVGAVGLDLADLFARTGSSGKASKRRHLITAAQALDLLHDEALLVAVAAANIAHGVELAEADKDRLLQAAARVAYLRNEVRA